MNRITQLDPSYAAGKARELLDAVQGRLGRVPNVMRVLANSPAALQAYLNLDKALELGVLSPKIRSQISLAVAEINDCEYCRSAHAYSARILGLTAAEIREARNIRAGDERTAAILDLARHIVVERGCLSESELKTVRIARITDEEIVETGLNVILNLLTNSINQLARTVVDFPIVVSLANEATVAPALD
jgi:uncharacterized peroxidase-related enzyme